MVPNYSSKELIAALEQWHKYAEAITNQLAAAELVVKDNSPPKPTQWASAVFIDQQRSAWRL